jgi:hypothetical protein
MAKHRLVVFTNAMPGRDAEFNKWYDEVHLREVVEVDGFAAAQRFVLSADQIGELDADSVPGRYLAIYEIDAEDLKSAFDKLNAASGGGMTMSDALDSSSAKAIAYTALGERYTG